MLQPKFADYFIEAAYLPFEFSIQMGEPAPAPGAEPSLRFQRLRFHEYQHGLDHAGTPWGLELSRQIFEAVGSLQEGATEIDLWRLIRLHDTVRRLNHDRYYRTPGPAALTTPRNRWGWEFTVGLEFSADGRVDQDRPIIFTRFKDSRTDAVIQRQPLSPAALLEARAIFVELQLAMTAADPESEVREFVDRAYDPGLAEYSAAAHTVATTLGLDIVAAYEAAAAAAWYALLLPQFDPTDLTTGPWTATLGGRKMAAFARNRDPGFVFATLIQAGALYEGNARAWLDLAAARAGLPSVDVAIRQARETIGVGTALETRWGRREFEYLRQTTLNNLIVAEDQFGLLMARDRVSDLERLHLADVRYEGGGVHLHKNRVLPGLSPADLKEMSNMIQGGIDWFLTACR